MTEWCAVDSHCSAISVDSYMPTGRLYRDYSCVDSQATFSVSLDKKPANLILIYNYLYIYQC